MIYRFLADAVLLLHLAFVAFVLLGGLLVLRWPKLLWLHLPAFAWGVLVQSADWVCPLTPLENHLRLLGGQAVYAGGFIERIVSPLLYPEQLTPGLRYSLALALVAVNVATYACVIARRR
ncbi:MAG: DUF2784 domain-containing protein [Noviherbaspirillum sp.]